VYKRQKLQQAAPLLIEFQLIQKQVKSQQQQLNKVVADSGKSQHNYTQIFSKLTVAEVRLKKYRDELEVAEIAKAERESLDSMMAVRIPQNSGNMPPLCDRINPESESDLFQSFPTSNFVDITPLREKIATANQVFQVIQLSAIEAKSAISALHERESEIDQILKENLNRVDKLRQQITLILDKPQWSCSQLQQELTILQESDLQYREAEQQFQQLAVEYDRLQQLFTFVLATQAARQEEYQNAIVELEQRQQQLRICANALYQITEDRPYDNLAQSLKQDKQDLETLLKFAENNYQKAHGNIIQATKIDEQATIMIEQAIVKKQMALFLSLIHI
jgi:exonuclease SbcC